MTNPTSGKELQLHTSNLPDLITHYKDIRPVSFEQGIKAPSPKLEKVAAVLGEQAASGIVSACLTEITMNLAFDVSEGMIRAAADAISSRWNDIKVAELKLFKEMVLSGAIGGKLYRLDTRVFCELFEEFYLRRLDAFETLVDRKYTDEGLKPLQELLNDKKKDMTAKDLYGPLKEAATKEKELELWRLKSKNMDLEMMCKNLHVPYSSVLDLCDKDCREIWDESSVVPYDAFFKNHLQRLQIEAKKDPAVLMAYKI
jgi:hypothetical protein